MNNYLGAYQLLKLRPLDFGAFKGQKVLTGSTCINPSLYDAWSLSWTEDGQHNWNIPKTQFQLSDRQIKAIQAWADPKFNDHKLGWVNIFHELDTLRQYYHLFFSTKLDAVAIAIYFPGDALSEIIKAFEPQSKQEGQIGILRSLKKQIPESKGEGKFIGYDLIGIEISGAYHSFHCYDCTQELLDKFQLTLNKYGLIDALKNPQQVLDFAHNPENGLPSIPWFLVKVKQVDLSSGYSQKLLE
ncbi:MAG: hypothetical protein AAFV80_22890 [Bacteroidota bacterium]